MRSAISWLAKIFALVADATPCGSATETQLASFAEANEITYREAMRQAGSLGLGPKVTSAILQLAALLDEGKAYRCFCTTEELDKKRKAAEAEKRQYRYDRACRDRTDRPDAPFTVRLKVPLEGTIGFDDLVATGSIAEARVSLSPRELESLNMAFEGLTARETALRMDCSERTVNYHLANAMAKLKTDNKLAAVQRACWIGLI